MLFDFFVGAVLDVLDLVRDLVSRLVGALFALMLALFGPFVDRVLGVAPGFFGRALGLIGHSAVRHFLVSYGFAGFLFNLARDLTRLAAYLVVIHDLLLLSGLACLVLPRSRTRPIPFFGR